MVSVCLSWASAAYVCSVVPWSPVGPCGLLWSFVGPVVSSGLLWVLVVTHGL